MPNDPEPVAAQWLAAGRLRGAAFDTRCAQALHRGASSRVLRSGLAGCSRLGDGAPWVLMLIVLTLAGGAGLHCARLMLAVGGVNLLMYFTLKRLTRRPRPYQQCPGIRAFARPQDAFSFPSGHTMHAVAFALLISAHYPPLAPLLWAFAALVGMSRVVLGLHYPSDVLFGAALGAATAGASLWLAGP